MKKLFIKWCKGLYLREKAINQLKKEYTNQLIKL